MIRSKYLAIAALALSFGALTACDSTSSSNAPTVSEFESANFTESTDTLKIGNYIDFYGKVTDDQGLKSWSLTVLNSAGSVVYTASVPTISGTSVSFDLPSKSSTNLRVSNDGSWGATGQYTVRLTVTNSQGNSINADQKIYAEGKGSSATSTLATVNTLSVAAQGVSGVNSFISIGNAISYSGTETKTKYTSTDLVVTYDAVDTTQTNFESTAAAVSDGSFSLTYWGAGRATLIKDVGTTEPVSLATAQALIGTAQTAAIVNGHYYVVKTVEGVYAVLYASSVSGIGNGMTLTVKILN